MNVYSPASRSAESAPLPFESLPPHVHATLPVDIWVDVSPAHPANQLWFEHRSHGRARPAVRAWPEAVNGAVGTQRFRARMPALSVGETAEYRPVLSRAGLVVQQLPSRETRGIEAPAMPAEADKADASAPEASPRYEWTSEFLGAFTAHLKPPQAFGACPEGIRITYWIDSGEIRGPRMNGKLTGADWLLLRPDGVGVADVRLTYEMDDGALVLSRYSGIVDLGADAYERALRNDFDPEPPLVLTPQFSTSHPNWLWMNRVQCLGVGRANLVKSLVRMDIYSVCTKATGVRSGALHA